MKPSIAIRTILFCLVGLAVFLGEIQAQGSNDRWIYVVSSNNGMRVYVEKTYEENKNGNKVIWAKFVNKDDSKGLSLYEIDCKSARFKTLEAIEYDKQGKVTQSNTFRFPDWERVIPDSIMEAMYEEICGLAKRTPPPPPPPTYREPETRSKPPEKPDLGVDYAVVTSTRANLRSEPSTSAAVLLEAPQNDLLVLLDTPSVGSWYKVLHVKSNQEGWIHSSTVTVHYTQERKPSLTFEGTNTGSLANPTLKVTNDSSKTMTLKIGDVSYTFTPKESKTIYLKPGTYKYYASAPGVIPDFGEDAMKAGWEYSWKFYIVTTRR